jgi:cytochrome P450
MDHCIPYLDQHHSSVLFRAILHHPDEYPEPEAFKPERYLTKTLAGGYVPNPDAPDPRITAFGFGRRICPGRYMANASIFASVATVLATMSIVRPKDVEGQDIVPEVAQSSGFISHPKPFEYVLEYRSAKSRALLEAALEHSAEH